MYTWLAWGIFAVICLIVLAFSGGFVLYYKLPDEPAGITGTIGFFSLVFTLLSLFLIPVDVYMVSSNSYTSDLENDVKYTYYAFYLIFMFFVFVGLPFAYFYYEELGDLEDRSNKFSQRACEAMKYTSCFAFTWIVLIVIGMFVDFSSHDTTGDSEWTETIANRFKSHLSTVIPFCMAILICVGLFFSMVYTAWGMASFPISIMKSIPVENVRRKESLDVELNNLESNLRHIDNKYRGREDDMTTTDRVRKKTWESQKRALEAEKQASGGGRKQARDTCCNKCGRCLWGATAPIRYLVGILLLLWTVLLISSIAIHLVDQIINSSCGYQCGFAIEKRVLPNPIGIILTESSKIFPFDYIIFGIIVFWLFWCTVIGLMMIDVRFLCFKLFSLRPGGTMHNALMMAIMFVILVVCSFTYNVYNLAPDYVQYGHQTGCSSDSDCSATVVYNLITGIMVGMPIFGLIYFAFSWIFVAVSILSLVVNILRTPKSKYGLLDEDDDLEAIFKE